MPTPEPIDTESGGAWLESAEGHRWPLFGKCSLGRGPENDIVIDSPKASRKHAVIHVQDEVEFWLIDQVSQNGTYRNDHRVVRPTRLRDGDRLTVGGGKFLFRQPAQAQRHAGEATTIYSGQSTAAGDATVVDLRQQHVWLLIADIKNFTVLSREWEVNRLALSVGQWLRECHRIVEKHSGRISKYLGDGFLACWEDREGAAGKLVETLREFQQLQRESTVRFRVALHYGLVTFGGQSASGEESMLGPDMNFIFRLEDLASELGKALCLSQAAHTQLKPFIATVAIPGEFELKGFANTHRCFTLDADSPR